MFEQVIAWLPVGALFVSAVGVRISWMAQQNSKRSANAAEKSAENSSRSARASEQSAWAAAEKIRMEKAADIIKRRQQVQHMKQLVNRLESIPNVAYDSGMPLEYKKQQKELGQQLLIHLSEATSQLPLPDFMPLVEAVGYGIRQGLDAPGPGDDLIPGAKIFPNAARSQIKKAMLTCAKSYLAKLDSLENDEQLNV